MPTIIWAVLGGFPQTPHGGARTLHCNMLQQFFVTVVVTLAATMLTFGVNITLHRLVLFHSNTYCQSIISWPITNVAMFKTKIFSSFNFLHNYCNAYSSCLIFYLVLCILKSFSSIASFLLSFLQFCCYFLLVCLSGQEWMKQVS